MPTSQAERQRENDLPAPAPQAEGGGDWPSIPGDRYKEKQDGSALYELMSFNLVAYF